MVLPRAEGEGRLLGNYSTRPDRFSREKREHMERYPPGPARLQAPVARGEEVRV